MNITKQELQVAEDCYNCIVSALEGTSWASLAKPLDEIYASDKISNQIIDDAPELEAAEYQTVENDETHSFGMH